MPTYYTRSGQVIRNPCAYAKTGAPMYPTRRGESKDMNAPTAIYKMNLEDGKKYVGKTTDVDRRMDEHFSGRGSQVTRKFKPVSAKIVAEVPGYYSDVAEQAITEECIGKHGYQNVRGGTYTNSKTLRRSATIAVTCFNCGEPGHYANQCSAKTKSIGSSFNSTSDDEDSSDYDDFGGCDDY